MLFRGALLNGVRVDARVTDGRIAALIERAAGTPLQPLAGEDVVDGGMLTPPSAEPHVHLDATLLGARVPNRSGTLREGIANWASIRGTLTRVDVLERARTTLSWYLDRGTTRVRTHVDTGCPVAVEALLELRDDLRSATPGSHLAGMELAVVAFPQEGILRRPGLRAQWEDAVRLGCDAVGAIPHFERTTEEGWASVKMAFDLAEKYGRKLDFHCDETDDPASRNLEVVCAQAIDRGFGAERSGSHVVAGHCTAMHSYPNPYAAKVCELVAIAGVQVVANPLDNVVLQGRYDGYPRRRGITRVDELWRAGASVGIGHDSVMDPWYRLGTANLLDAAYMLIHVAQLTGEDEMARVFRTLHDENHRPFGAIPRLEIGSDTFLWYSAADEIEAIRTREKPRVFVTGHEVSG
ncbi:MAG: cytosine deaminase [Myxococcales bacterium]|nr:cytosine deaminase [Myxococcales bacterium]